METPTERPQLPEAPFRVSTPLLLTWAFFAILFSAAAGSTAHYLSAVEQKPSVAHTAAAAEAVDDPFAHIELQAKAAYVYDAQTGETLYSKNPDVQLPLASITKVPLALAVAEVLPLDEVVTIPRNTSPPGSIEHLGAGEHWKVRDVLTFTLVASSNEGAEILAELAGDGIRARYGSAPEQDATLWRMNQLARELGLNRTYFLNVSGLDLSASQAGSYGTARDVANLFLYAASTSPAVFGGTARDGILLTSAGRSSTSAINTNQALDSIHGLIMGKTGYTDLAGGNLAILFDVGIAHPVVAVVLGSTFEGRFEDMKKIVAATEATVALQ